MTANPTERPDSARLGPGRIDSKLCLGKASDPRKVERYGRFFPDSSEIEAREFVAVSRSAETMAEFQGLRWASELRGSHKDPVEVDEGVLA
jgi:mitochondrial chaperone BCS1